MKELHYLKEIDSTNDYIVRLINNHNIESFDGFYTFNQTNGKGQKGNVWFADVDKNISYSLYFEPVEIEASKQFIISQVVSLSVVEVLSRYVCDITIKWPNDIYWKDEKVCGILIETRLIGKVITGCTVGIGININQEAFPCDLPNPISLRMITSKKYDLEQVTNELHKELIKNLSCLVAINYDSIRKNYFDLLYRKNKFYSYEDKMGAFKAKIIDVEYNGLFVLQKEDATIKKYYFKEIKFIL